MIFSQLGSSKLRPATPRPSGKSSSVQVTVVPLPVRRWQKRPSWMKGVYFFRAGARATTLTW
jgi:hypothetical protein